MIKESGQKSDSHNSVTDAAAPSPSPICDLSNSKSDTHNRAVSPSTTSPARGKGCRYGWKELNPSEVRLHINEGLLEDTRGLSKNERDKIFVLYSMIMCRYFTGKCDSDDFTSFNRKTFRWITDRHYARYLAFLKDRNHIKIDDSYQAGSKTKRYKAIIRRVVSITVHNKPLAKKFARKKQIKHNKVMYTAKLHEREAAALWMMEVIENKMGLHYDKAKRYIDSQDPQTDEEFLQQQYDEACFDALVYRQFHFGMCPRTGRFFSNFTNLSRKLRPFILMDAKSPVDIDINTAQPYLLSALYPERNEEWKRYVDDILNYDFYTQFVKEGISRDEAKKQVFTYILFGRNEIAKYGILWEPFKEKYPQLADIIWKMKEKDHASVAIALQRLESQGMIGGVAGDLTAKKIPFVTIHDGILVEKPNVDLTVRLIKKHFSAITGVEPKVTIK